MKFVIRGASVLLLVFSVFFSSDAYSSYDEIKVSKPILLNSDNTHDTLLPSGEVWRTLSKLNLEINTKTGDVRVQDSFILGEVLGNYLSEILTEKRILEYAVEEYASLDSPRVIATLERHGYQILTEIDFETLNVELMLRSSRIAMTVSEVKSIYERLWDLQSGHPTFRFEGKYVGWVDRSREAFLRGFWQSHSRMANKLTVSDSQDLGETLSIHLAYLDELAENAFHKFKCSRILIEGDGPGSNGSN